jgi:hypothetical protein
MRKNKSLIARTAFARTSIVRTLVTVSKVFGVFFMIVVATIFGLVLVMMNLKTKTNVDEVVVLNNSVKVGSTDTSTIALFKSSDAFIWLYQVPLSSITQKQGSEELNSQKLSQQLEVLVQKSFSLTSLESDSDLSLKEQLVSNLATTIFGSRPDDGNFWDLLWWWWQLSAAPNSKVEFREFVSISDWLEYDLVGDLQLNSQPCSITVVNTTQETGLATKLATIFERSGLFVARLTDNQSGVSNSLLLTSEPEQCSQVIQTLQVLTPNSQNVVVDKDASNKYRADVVFFVGKDFVD